MKLNEFVNKYLNKKVDFDGYYGYQCVDLFRQYCKDVLNIPHTGGVAMKNAVTNGIATKSGYGDVRYGTTTHGKQVGITYMIKVL